MPISSFSSANSIMKPGVCTSTTRPASPYDGQVVYETDTDRVVAYNGAAWQTVGASGLTYITGASFTTTATVSMASGVFSASYQNYLVLLNITASSVSQTFSWRVNNAGSPRTAANYYGATVTTNASGVTNNLGSLAATSFRAGNARTDVPWAGYAINVYAPADAATRTAFSFHGFGYNATNDGSALTGGCIYDVAETNDGLTFFVSGTISGSYKVYGLANS